MSNWSCSSCTYLNESNFNRCEMCNQPSSHSIPTAQPSPKRVKASESAPDLSADAFLAALEEPDAMDTQTNEGVQCLVCKDRWGRERKCCLFFPFLCFLLLLLYNLHLHW